MYRTQRVCVSLILSALLSACGANPGDAEKKSAPAPVEQTAVGEMVGTMDKARAVQDTLDQQKRDMDEALQQAEGR